MKASIFLTDGVSGRRLGDPVEDSVEVAFLGVNGDDIGFNLLGVAGNGLDGRCRLCPRFWFRILLMVSL